MKRCQWVGDDENSLMMTYHDKEWGVPVHDDVKLFEFLILEGAQAGLSWSTILKKRENYRKAFDGFNFKKIAKYDDTDVERFLNDAGIIRNRLKIASTIGNAKATLKVIEEFGSLDKYIWSFVNRKPIKNSFKSMKELPVTTEISDRMSKDLKDKGFKFVGSTIMYAFMQAIGMVNDHEVGCHRYNQV
jgi:DNA-3-methyladenine glycosylase I